MSFFADPLTLFKIEGKVALVAGASGAFGTVAAKTLAGAKCRLALAAGNDEALAEIAGECQALGAETKSINSRPTTEETCEAMVQGAVEAFGRLDILVVAS